MGAQVRRNLGKRAAALSRTALAAENTAHRKFYYGFAFRGVTAQAARHAESAIIRDPG